MNIKLVLLRQNGQAKGFAVKGATVTVGRREDCDFRIPLGDVSRRHCQINSNNDVVKIRDLGSSNGTFLNGKQIEEEVLLGAGDVIKIGAVSFGVQINGSPESFEPQTEPEVEKETPKPAEKKVAAKVEDEKESAKPAVKKTAVKVENEFTLEGESEKPGTDKSAEMPAAAAADVKSDSDFLASLDLDLPTNGASEPGPLDGDIDLSALSGSGSAELGIEPEKKKD